MNAETIKEFLVSLGFGLIPPVSGNLTPFWRVSLLMR